MTDARAIDKVDFLRGEHFMARCNENIYTAILRVNDRKDAPEPYLVWQEMVSTKRAPADNSDLMLAHLQTLVNSAPSGANAKRYGEMVRNRWLKRNGRAIALDAADKFDNPNGDTPEKIVRDAVASLEALLPSAHVNRRFLRELLNKTVERIDAEFNGVEWSEKPISTGLRDLDEKLDGGMRGGEVVIIGGRPGSGKTAAALCVADAAGKPDAVALVFSQEMPGEQLALRALARASGLSINKLKNGRNMVDADWSLVHKGLSELREDRVIIDDRPGLSLAQVRSVAREVQRQNGLSCIVLDYLQLMAETEGDNRAQAVGANSRGLKSLAKELNVPIVVLSQLSRKVEERMDKHPLLSDLRDSGEIEQDADIVVLLYRNGYYYPGCIDEDIAELNVAKHRNGETGLVRAQYVGERTAFYDVDPGRHFASGASDNSQPGKRSRNPSF